MAAPRLPEWFKVRAPGGARYQAIRSALRERGLSTVCEQARCPNLAECWSGGQSGKGTATLMVMGATCTRGCRFCAVGTGRPGPLDPEEPRKASETVGVMGVSYVVITSVDRDDLPDGGADHFGKVVERCKADHPGLLVEVLTPDFVGRKASLERIVQARPDVCAHNLETVRRLSPTVRDRRAGYDQSLAVLREYKALGARFTKTSLMLGLGEREGEVRESLEDLRAAGVDIVTFGQYLRPTREPRHLAVEEFVPPERFQAFQRMAEGMGFRYVASGPLVRSSYRAGELFLEGALRA
ncbi:MAG: lipoyl synthase [Thermoplasmatota archaeon]